MRSNCDGLMNEQEWEYKEVYNALCNLRPLDFPSIFEGDLTEFGKWLNGQIDVCKDETGEVNDKRK